MTNSIPAGIYAKSYLENINKILSLIHPPELGRHQLGIYMPTDIVIHKKTKEKYNLLDALRHEHFGIEINLSCGDFYIFASTDPKYTTWKWVSPIPLPVVNGEVAASDSESMNLITFCDQSILNLKFTNNFTATINVNWVSPVKKREIILAGSNSSIIFDDISVEKVKVYDTGELGDDYNINSVKGYRNIEIPDMIEPLAQGYEEFKNSIKEDRQPLTSLERSLKIQSWVNQW